MISLRLARKDDMECYFQWANDPTVREQAINTEPIEWEDHQRWFNARLESDSIMLILLKQERPVGQIRFDPIPNGYLLSYLIDSAERGKGLGTRIVQEGLKWMESHRDFSEVLAQVKEKNIPSSKVFVRLGFDEVDRTKLKEETYRQFIWKC